MLNMVLLCRKTKIVHRGVTYRNGEKNVAETMEHYGVDLNCIINNIILDLH